MEDYKIVRLIDGNESMLSIPFNELALHPGFAMFHNGKQMTMMERKWYLEKGKREPKVEELRSGAT